MTYRNIPSTIPTKRASRRVVGVLTAAAIAVGVAALPAGANAAAPAPSSPASSTTPNTYTLNGKASTAAGVASAGACAGIPDAKGVVACFTSESGLLKAQAAAARAGKAPVGWGYLPSDVSGATTASRIEGETASPTPQAATFGASPNTATDQCHPYTNIHIWNGARGTDTEGNIGPTGGWYNLSDTYSNHISSYWNSDYYTSYFSDYTNGNGATYGPIGHCHLNNDLSTAGVTMSDGGTANDRFSAAYVGS